MDLSLMAHRCKGITFLPNMGHIQQKINIFAPM
jgi:hypothetical protein